MNPWDDTLTGAIFSEDRKYRFALWRRWNKIRPLMLLIGLNPSKADEVRNDPTITRGISRANKEGFGGFFMGNLYGLVSTQPEALLKNSDSVGELTDYWLEEMIKASVRQLCGWGSFKAVKQRSALILSMIREPYCLGINADGQPKHPLYISYDTPMTRYLLKGKMNHKR